MMKSTEYKKKVLQDANLQLFEWWECQRSPYYFLTEWARTVDRHVVSSNPIQFFPKKEYIQFVVDTWLKEKLLLIPKTRQMMMSWLFVGLYLWDAQFHPGRLIFFQSKKAEDANDLIARAKLIYDYQPDFLKSYSDSDGSKLVPMEAKCLSDKILFPQIHSELRGIPEGGDIIRMHQASGIFSDEMGFQPSARAAYIAAKPSLSSKGRFTGVSTAEDHSFFENLVFDQID